VALDQAGPDLVGRQLRAPALVAGDDGPGGGNSGEPGEAEHLPQLHDATILSWTIPC
jgi:hypothetical protein